MPPKPTCKVVKRAGQKGARIAPKGCVVRTDEDAAGVKVRRNKAGDVKVTQRVRTDEVDFRLMVSYSPKFPERAKTNGVLTDEDRARYGREHNMLYDTGAQMTTMNVALLRDRLKLPGFEGRESRVTQNDIRELQGVTGSMETKIFRNVTFHVLVSENPDRWEKVTDDIWVSYNPKEVPTHNLLGVTAIRQLSFLKVKFLNANEIFV